MPILSHSLRSIPLRSPVFLLQRRSQTNYQRPSPPPLPKDLQREFEELQRKSQTPLSSSGTASKAELEAELALHPDARQPIKATFEGDVNPATGEEGGPKREPVGRWGEDEGGDWSFKGRVSDF